MSPLSFFTVKAWREGGSFAKGSVVREAKITRRNRFATVSSSLVVGWMCTCVCVYVCADFVPESPCVQASRSSHSRSISREVDLVSGVRLQRGQGWRGRAPFSPSPEQCTDSSSSTTISPTDGCFTLLEQMGGRCPR